jgi:hypothetical protein
MLEEKENHFNIISNKCYRRENFFKIKIMLKEPKMLP